MQKYSKCKKVHSMSQVTARDTSRCEHSWYYHSWCWCCCGWGTAVDNEVGCDQTGPKIVTEWWCLWVSVCRTVMFAGLVLVPAKKAAQPGGCGPDKLWARQLRKVRTRAQLEQPSHQPHNIQGDTLKKHTGWQRKMGMCRDVKVGTQMMHLILLFSQMTYKGI